MGAHHGIPGIWKILQQNIEKIQHRCFNQSTPDIVLQPLASRRLKFDLCEVYKYWMTCTKRTKPYTLLSQRTLRGNSLTLVKPFTRTLIKSNFSHGVVNAWNSLPNTVVRVRAPSLDSFQEKLRSQVTHVSRYKTNTANICQSSAIVVVA